MQRQSSVNERVNRGDGSVKNAVRTSKTSCWASDRPRMKAAACVGECTPIPPYLLIKIWCCQVIDGGCRGSAGVLRSRQAPQGAQRQGRSVGGAQRARALRKLSRRHRGSSQAGAGGEDGQ